MSTYMSKLMGRFWILGALIIPLVACDREGAEPKEVSASGRRALPEFDAPRDDRSKEIENLTGGQTRIVWAQQQDPGKTDAHANGNRHKLMGLGTRDGMGERVILGEVGNYARPMLTPDGKRVVYTDKRMSKKNDTKSYDPRCFVVNWDGSGRKELADAYADDLWVDPGTGITWVYAVENLSRNKQIAIWGERLVRFQLDAPGVREVLYEEGEIALNNLQVSRDGKRIATLFPWPYSGMLDVEKGKWESTGIGCWTSMCPDNSYLAWVFDGAHKNVTMVHPDSNEKWVVSVSNLPDFRNKEMYHPRWSNDPRFFVITGYYPAGSRGGSGEKVKTYIGKFDEGMTRVVGWARVTQNKLADIFPDVWVEGGETITVDLEKLGKAGEGESPVVKGRLKEVEAGTWPANDEGLVFAWDNVSSESKIEGRPCRLVLRGRARFGRFHDAVVGGGSAVPDAESSAVIGRLGGESSVEFLFTPDSDAEGLVFSDRDRVVFVADGRIFAKAGGIVWDGGAIQPGVPTHLALPVEGEDGNLFRDGARMDEMAGVEVPDTGGETVFGDGIWEGSVKGIGMYSRVLSEDEIAANAATWKARVSERTATSRVVLTGRLVEATPLKTKTEIGAYNRALAVYTYEVESVKEGAYEKANVLVSHWYFMDDVFLSSMPREIGKTFELTIEPAADHPQIESELNDYDGADFETPVYFDVTTPEP